MRRVGEKSGGAAGIWIRVSTDKQADTDSPEHHELRAREYAKRTGWDVVEVYGLEGTSGKSVLGHPEAKRMMADVERGRIRALIFSDVSRLARNSRELLFLSDYFNQHGAKLVALSEQIDTSTPDGEYFFTLRAGGAQYERRIIAARIKASVPVRAQLGKRTGGESPFGYRFVNNKMEIDPGEAPIRALIYELFVEHRRITTVARLLNEAGHRTRSGGLFTRSTVERLIRDPTAKGVRIANYTQRSADGKRAELKPESEWVRIPVEPIISEALWDHAQTLLAPPSPHRPSRRLGKKPVHLFSGVVVCGNCTVQMYPLSNSPKYTCPKCRRKIHPADLEGIFLSQLRAFVLSPERLAAHIEQADAEVAEKASLLATLQAERSKLQKAMDKTYELYIGDHISPQQFETRHRPLEERAAQLDAEIPDLAADVDARRLHLLSRDATVGRSQSLADHWPKLPFEERRQVVESIVESIIIGEDEVTVSLHPPPILKEGANCARRGGTAPPWQYRGGGRPAALGTAVSCPTQRAARFGVSAPNTPRPRRSPAVTAPPRRHAPRTRARNGTFPRDPHPPRPPRPETITHPSQTRDATVTARSAGRCERPVTLGSTRGPEPPARRSPPLPTVPNPCQPDRSG